MTQDLDDLKEKIDKARHANDPTPEQIKSNQDTENTYAGIQAGIEFVSSIFVMALAGYGLDYWLGTKPAFFLILFFLGICTGFYNVYRITQNMGTAVGIYGLHKQKKSDKKSPDSKESENG